MVDNCRHVRKIRVAKDHSILNPQKWMCNVCATTESVWACLSCPNVSCGRYIEEHALYHYNLSKHPLSMEVNDKYVFCYECDEYVLNDNAAGDLKLLRNALGAIASQNFDGMERRGKRMLRSKSASFSFHTDANKLVQADRCHTAIVHRRFSLLHNIFTRWKDATQRKKPEVFIRKPNSPPKRKTPPKAPAPPKPLPSTAPAALGRPPRKRKRTNILPGVVGLRNLGNTCYMNAILQVLSFSFSSLDELRQYFAEEQMQEQRLLAEKTAAAEKGCVIKLDGSISGHGSISGGSISGPRQSARLLERQTTVECYQRINYAQCSHQKQQTGGLNGGGTVKRPKHAAAAAANSKQSLAKRDTPKSLSNELHALFRVMWSGKWAIVSPHSLLHAVWNVIPFFKGYTQQDAQEFMCEFLDKVENEIQNESCQRQKLMRIASNVVKDTFQGEIVSEVRCLTCDNTSRTYEPFYDLSLEFPDRYQMTRVYRVVSEDGCHLTEMLAKFTEEERLEGKIYSCTKCNLKRRRASKKPVVLTEAKKQLLISKLPKVIRLHLKRFRWSGRNHREKINVHVSFDQELDMSPFINQPHATGNGPTLASGNGNRSSLGAGNGSNGQQSGSDQYVYQLSAVVIHHGRGFSSGHYTAYCWNDEANSWVHCNDARVEPTQINHVLRSQAYILLYTRKGEKIQLDQLADLHENLVSEVVDDLDLADIQPLKSAPAIVNIDADVSFKLDSKALLTMPDLSLDDGDSEYSKGDRWPETVEGTDAEVDTVCIHDVPNGRVENGEEMDLNNGDECVIVDSDDDDVTINRKVKTFSMVTAWTGEDDGMEAITSSKRLRTSTL